MPPPSHGLGGQSPPTPSRTGGLPATQSPRSLGGLPRSSKRAVGAAAHGRTQTRAHAAASEHAPKEPAAARHGGEKHTNAMGIMCQNGSFGLSRDALSDRTILV